MLTLTIVNVSVPVKSAFDRGWDMGSRVGTFDACGGRDIRDFSGVEETDYNAGYVAGYSHAFAAFC